MRRATLVWISCVAAACAVAADESQHAASISAESSVQLTDGPGRTETMARCPICHSLDYIPMNASVMDRATWQRTVQKMRERFGAPMTDEEAAQITDYLSANYADHH
jgi:hypothetical protein